MSSPRKVESQAYIHRLPLELLHEIFTQGLRPEDFHACRRTCRGWMAATEEASLFRRHCGEIVVAQEKSPLSQLKPQLFAVITRDLNFYQKCLQGLAPFYRSIIALPFVPPEGQTPMPALQRVDIFLSKTGDHFARRGSISEDFPTASVSEVSIFETFSFASSGSKICQVSTAPIECYDGITEIPRLTAFYAQDIVHPRWPRHWNVTFVGVLLGEDGSANVLIKQSYLRPSSTLELRCDIREPCMNIHTQERAAHTRKVIDVAISPVGAQVAFLCEAGAVVYHLESGSSGCGSTVPLLRANHTLWIPTATPLRTIFYSQIYPIPPITSCVPLILPGSDTLLVPWSSERQSIPEHLQLSPLFGAPHVISIDHSYPHSPTSPAETAYILHHHDSQKLTVVLSTSLASGYPPRYPEAQWRLKADEEISEAGSFLELSPPSNEEDSTIRDIVSTTWGSGTQEHADYSSYFVAVRYRRPGSTTDRIYIYYFKLKRTALCFEPDSAASCFCVSANSSSDGTHIKAVFVGEEENVVKMAFASGVRRDRRGGGCFLLRRALVVERWDGTVVHWMMNTRQKGTKDEFA
ncbi:hypothetical protein BZA05DRAFT_433761 [Tricharina praecox]|uniref:uncharacterized protein n=1 Tax=Tricharina praecox TaxID=43433 RepID=UPI00221EDB68|nr:uncharacterized protein BZA05DRAFT_433761 [Tricharina praecox]KAI5857128.1 hypothetical protein BZA05DRAFT_433761 [Tricharina praecox]